MELSTSAYLVPNGTEPPKMVPWWKSCHSDSDGSKDRNDIPSFLEIILKESMKFLEVNTEFLILDKASSICLVLSLKRNKISKLLLMKLTSCLLFKTWSLNLIADNDLTT